MDRKRDAPIPWSVSLPCVAAVVALAFGWRTLGRRPATSSAPDPKPVVATAQEIPPPAAVAPERPPTPTPVPTRTPAPTPVPAPSPAKPKAPPVAKSPWTPLPEFGAEGFDDGAQREAVAAVVQLRDRLGPDASGFFVRAEPSARVFVVTSARGCADRGDQLIRFLAPFGTRLDALVLRPAKIAAATRPWVAVHVAEDDPTPQGGESFAGFGVAAMDDAGDARTIGCMAAVQQLRQTLARGPESRPLDWLLVGAVGAAASESLDEAVRFHDPNPPYLSTGLAAPVPSLSELLQWRTLDDWMLAEDHERRAALATSFVAFCLQRGPKDPRAAGLFELLKLDGRALPQEPAACDAEVAARLGATRLDELEASWTAARR